MYEQSLALNKLQGLICHKTQPTYFNKHFYIRTLDNQNFRVNCDVKENQENPLRSHVESDNIVFWEFFYSYT